MKILVAPPFLMRRYECAIDWKNRHESENVKIPKTVEISETDRD